MADREYGFRTRAIHAGNIPDAVTGARALPIFQSSAFVFDDTADAAARFALQIVRHFPGRQARNVTCPIFFAICEQDAVAPPKPTQKYAAQAPRSEIKLYDTGHFDIYVGDDFERNVTDQLAFLSRHVPATAAS